MATFPDDTAFRVLPSAIVENADFADGTPTQDVGLSSVLEIAKAHSQYLVQTKQLRDALVNEADADGLTEKYEPLFRQAYDGSAALISDPQQRELWAQNRLPDLDGHVLAASDRAFDLTRDREIAGAAMQLDAMRELAVQTADPVQRLEFIRAANGLISGLHAAGYIDEPAAQGRQKAWAQDFALDAFSKLPAVEQVKWLEEDAQDRGDGKGELIDFVPADMRESLLQTARLNLHEEERAAQSAAALERHNVEREIRDDLAAILKEGKGLDSLAPEQVQTILGPDALRDWQEAREDFTAIRGNTEDLYALTDSQLDERLQSLSPSGDTRDDPRKSAIFLEVQNQAAAMRRLRASDPAKSVEDDPLVRTAAERAQPGDPQAVRELYAARLSAQERAGIDRDAQSPITKDEALPLIAPLEGARPGQERDVLARVSATFNEQFGADADRAFAFALRAQQSEAEEIFAAMRAVRSMRLGGEGQRPIWRANIE
jgi:hypothetical protein